MPEQPGSASTNPSAPEDSYFVLRESRELFQRRLSDIARQSGITSSSTLEAFSGEIGAVHDELAASAQQDGFEQTDGLTASRISLVGNDDLELEIRIGEIANRLKNNERIGHWRVQLRYMTLLDRSKMTAENNPAGIEPVSRGLWAICRESGDNLEQNLDRLDRLEEKLQARLPEVYSELNALLERHRIAPAQVKIVQRAAAGKSSDQAVAGRVDGPGSHDSPGGSNALSTLQQILRKQLGGDDPAPADHLPGRSAGGSANVALDVSTLVMLNHLMDQLRNLEQRQLAGVGQAASAAPGQPPQLRALRSQDLDLPMGQPAAVALDTLSLIFEAIFSAPDLPDAVKAAIGRLQIPLLKQAILDAAFFTDTQHPARQLVNRMAQAAIGLGLDAGRDNAMCISLGKLADAVRTTLEAGAGELTPHLAELDTLIAERDRANQANSQPYVQLVVEHENREAARSGAEAWLGRALINTAEPAFRKFLAEHWLKVMETACLDGGTTGTRWQDNASCIDELLWSVQPKASAEERRRLIALIPSLLKRINAELDELVVPTEDRAPFINACLDLQTAALRNRPGAPEPAKSAAAPAPLPPATAGPLPGDNPEPETTVHLLERSGKLVQYLGLPKITPSRWGAAARDWQEGDWIRFALPDGEQLCGRLCWQGPDSGTVLLYNAGWGYAVALAPSSLEQQLRGGGARIVSATSLFDEAAERALGQIARH
ncbi:DUF1631 family protein [Propionivibrio sp.]|uniref:DUF1631 family protein n=1 Tax=Propionivibrio sp. TaxID=2212460 RepID=UPI0025F69B71|nr:DUF1631 family protein [Propionivibrio sp.]MBK8744968.1 DUF1631 family protein [Propionivibrio sp.]